MSDTRRRMIFHLPFEIDQTRFSASQLRPMKMLHAFKELGYDVFEVTGNAKARKERIDLLKRELDDGNVFHFCYSESSTMPSLLTEDHHLPSTPFLEPSFFSLLKRKGIPLGIFYRDIYWKFDSYRKVVGWIKSSFASFFYHVDFWMYHRYADVIYLPTISMAKYLPADLRAKSQALPPGAEHVGASRNELPQDPVKPLTFIYVGGVTPPHYDLRPLFELAAKYKKFRFTVICRREEWNQVKGIYSLSDNIDVVHASGNALTLEYQKADIFLNIREPGEYLHFAMPMKIFEALQENKPIITSNLHEVAKLITSNRLGWVINKNEDFDHLLASLEMDRTMYEDVRSNISKFITTNTWVSRAEQVENSLAK